MCTVVGFTAATQILENRWKFLHSQLKTLKCEYILYIDNGDICGWYERT